MVVRPVLMLIFCNWMEMLGTKKIEIERLINFMGLCSVESTMYQPVRVVYRTPSNSSLPSSVMQVAGS